MKLACLFLSIFFLNSCEDIFESSTSETVDIEWVFVKGGQFLMTANKDKKGHLVILSDFYISKYEVTNIQFSKFLDAYKSDTVKSGEYTGKIMFYKHIWGMEKDSDKWVPVPGYENYPALNITWYGAKEYCEFYGWRLATEAEWEYGAKGGIYSKGYLYSGSDTIDLVAWYSPTYENAPGTHSHEVGQKLPNELGIYDMSGNVWEWVYDFYGEYDTEKIENPIGPEKGINHVYRGGSWLSVKDNCRNTVRVGGGIDYHGVTHNGIRVVKPE